MIRKKLLTVQINKNYKFDKIIQAHRDMESRKASGLNIIKISYVIPLLVSATAV